MGPSGSGKTTLLDVLAGRKTSGRIQGELRFSGVRPSAAYQRKHTGYVEQVREGRCGGAGGERGRRRAEGGGHVLMCNDTNKTVGRRAGGDRAREGGSGDAGFRGCGFNINGDACKRAKRELRDSPREPFAAGPVPLQPPFPPLQTNTQPTYPLAPPPSV